VGKDGLRKPVEKGEKGKTARLKGGVYGGRITGKVKAEKMTKRERKGSS